MRRFSKFLLATLATCVTTGAATAQMAAQNSWNTATTTTAPVAYVYVDGFLSYTSSRIYGFAAAPNGHLTPISGSPFATPVSALALNGKYLFGTYSPPPPQPNGIYTYSIAANGSIKQADFLDKTDLPSNYFSLIDLTLDHTGNSLYAGFTDGVGDNGYESFSINQTNGQLKFVNVAYTAVDAYGFISFVGNNEYAYGADCYHTDPLLYGLARGSSGGLTEIATNSAMPPAPPSSYGYCPLSVAADPYNDLAVSLVEQQGTPGPAKYQLAVYTADAYGHLSTTSTYQNMPLTAVEPDFVSMSPKGYYLAATGNTGLQIFLMHGSKPLTVLTGAILPGVSLGEAFWDNHEHLYVINRSQLYVFNVSTNGVSQARGSPYSIPAAVQSLSVLPK